MSRTKKSFTQIFSIVFAISQAEAVGKNEMIWIRKEMKNWFKNLI